MTMTVKERAIPYSAPMMRARRAGLKTMTRRGINPQPTIVEDRIPTDDVVRGVFKVPVKGSPGSYDCLGLKNFAERCPYGKPGDRLWTREAWKTTPQFDHLPPREIPRTAPIWYLADGEAPFNVGRYRHGRFMMRWMSRGLDEITAVRVERLQDISEQDAMAEGVERTVVGEGWRRYADPTEEVVGIPPCDSARNSFQSLWEFINGEGSWTQNPWLWVIQYKVLQ